MDEIKMQTTTVEAMTYNEDSVKTTVLEVKEDGKIYVATGDSLILCADQEQAKKLIWRYCNRLAVDGIYRIPVKLEQVDRHPCSGCSTDCYNYQMCDCKNTYAFFKNQDDTESNQQSEDIDVTQKESQEPSFYKLIASLVTTHQMSPGDWNLGPMSKRNQRAISRQVEKHNDGLKDLALQLKNKFESITRNSDNK